MTYSIRPFTPNDYDDIVRVDNAAFPDYPSTADEMRHDDKRLCKFQRWVAEVNGRIVGVGECSQRPDRYHPQKFHIDGYVHPEFRNRSIGSALYDTVIAGLGAFDPILAICGVEEDKTHSVEFLQKRGMQEASRQWPSRLNLSTVDTTPYAGLEQKLKAHGVEIKTFSELASDPDRDRKLYELREAIHQDVPAAGGMLATPISFEKFIESYLYGPNLIPDAYFIAIHKGEYIGRSDLHGTNGNKIIRTGLTGVKRTYRRKGIALALKLRAIEYAKCHGYEKIETFNNSINRPMLSINERLGFDKQPAIIVFKKVFREEKP